MKTKAKGTNDDSNAVAMRENDTTLVVDDYELDEEIHKQICQLADSTLWLKFTKSGFVLDRETGTTTKTITGVVIHEDAGWVRFPEEPGSPPDKKRLDEMAKEQAAAEGF